MLWSNFLEEHHILSPEIWGKTFTGRFRKCSDGYIFPNPPVHRMGNATNILYPRCEEREESDPRFIIYWRLSKTTLDFTSELIHLNCPFNIPFKISLKAIIMGPSSQFHDGIQLEILPRLLEVFLRHLPYCRRKAFHDNEYDKINELFNFKCNLVSRFNNLRILLLNWAQKKLFEDLKLLFKQ